MSHQSLHDYPIINEFPDFTDTFPGHLYHCAERDEYVCVFDNLYDEPEINNWVPAKVNMNLFRMVREVSEEGVPNGRFYAYELGRDEISTQPPGDFNHTLADTRVFMNPLEVANTQNKIPFVYRDKIPIVSDTWGVIPGSLIQDIIVGQEPPAPSIEEPILTEGPILTTPTYLETVLTHQSLVRMLLEPLQEPAPLLLQPHHYYWPMLQTIDIPMGQTPLLAECQLLNPKPKPQKRIADVMIADAVSKGVCCPITMNPLTLESATCVAPCYHIFEKEAITTWLTTKITCPECREICSI
jgi:hypothetical protein